MGVPTNEEKESSLSPKIYQPPSEDMEDIMESPRKKKMFSSSSFFEEPNSIYPTIEEQVELCRKIAESLSDDCNQKSKGANMFFKRVKKAEKWIVAESNAKNEKESLDSSKDPSKIPYVRPSKGLPKLKLILDPRQIIDMKKLIEEGVDIVQHNAVSPDVCHDIVKDLNSPTGKGAQLFAKRKKKSVEWIVDEDKVKHLLQERYQIEYPSPIDYPDLSQEPLVHPRVRALSEVNSQVVKDTIIRAAEAKVMTYPNAVPHLPVISSLDRMNENETPVLHTPLQSSCFSRTSVWSTDAYKYSYPKGWTSTTSSPSANQSYSSPVPDKSPKTSNVSVPEAYALEHSPSRTFNFQNFNASPKAWSSEIKTEFQPAVIKPVRPPSVLLQ
ncbi:uncharacterized protein [Parasteatoda tepidariorum]|uniref:uncharacterized protein n=1 Tax=Parasteatoda tepidariorum TaxID=114398 RepID=UPI0039BC9941